MVVERQCYAGLLDGPKVRLKAGDVLVVPRGEIAFQVGYDSEAAFSRAFKKFVGVSPDAWRKSRSGEDRRRGG